jgi:hypothetical protein
LERSGHSLITTVPSMSGGNRGKSSKTSVGIADVTTNSRTKQLSNTSSNCYLSTPLTKLLGLKFWILNNPIIAFDICRRALMLSWRELYCFLVFTVCVPVKLLLVLASRATFGSEYRGNHDHREQSFHSMLISGSTRPP